MKTPTLFKFPVLVSYVFIAMIGLSTLTGCAKKDDANNTTTCTNGVKDGTETGIDCGGSCGACGTDPCTNGIKDGTETGVDCGGSCSACTANDYRIKTWTTVVSGDSSVKTYTYDNKGRLTSVSEAASGSVETETYTYKTDSVIGVNSPTTYTDVFVLNAQGYASVWERRTPGSTARKNNTYDSEGHLINDGDIFVWTGGNLMSRSGSASETYTYYTDKTNTIGNANMGIGFMGVSSKNVLKTQTTSSITITVTYQYDSMGRITEQKSGTITMRFTYY